VSPKMSIRRKPRHMVRSRFERVQEATRHGAETARQSAEAARQGASTAAERIGPVAQHTREIAADRVLVARVWSAPRLARAAQYVEADLAPRMGSALKGAAVRVEPPRHGRRRRKTALMMLAALAAIGVAGAVLTRRGGQEFTEPDPDLDDKAVLAESEVDGQVRAPR
jgi:hypothetical protein